MRSTSNTAGAAIETRLLNPPNEAEQLSDWAGQADVVLVDAPCSGSGTWRRNPEGRWRLTPERLARLVATQDRLLDLGAPALCIFGGLAEPLRPWLPPPLQEVIIPPAADALDGAILLGQTARSGGRHDRAGL